MYESNNCGKYKVLNERYKGKRRGYDIKFLDTGFQKWERNGNVRMGSVYDTTISNDLFLGKVFNSNNYGKFMLIGMSYLIKPNKKYNDKHYVIKFLNTGYRHSEQKHHLWTGEVRDKFYDSIPTGYTYKSEDQEITVIAKSRIDNHYIVKGHKNNSIWHCDGSMIHNKDFVDFLEKNKNGGRYGYINYLNLDNKILKKINAKWGDMLNRCYDKNNISYKYYGGQGVKVCDMWLRFDNFLLDVIKLKGFDKSKIMKNKLDLDKDKLQPNVNNSSKVYSKYTCCWLDKKENKSISAYTKPKGKSKKFKAINNNLGVIEYIYNRKRFCDKYSLNYNTVSKYLQTNRRKYKGWIFKEISEDEYIKNKI